MSTDVNGWTAHAMMLDNALDRLRGVPRWVVRVTSPERAGRRMNYAWPMRDFVLAPLDRKPTAVEVSAFLWQCQTAYNSTATVTQ